VGRTRRLTLGAIKNASGANMEEENLSSQEKENLTGSAMESLGVDGKEAVEATEPEGHEAELPKYAKERLGRQEKRHKKEMRDIQSQLAQLQQHVQQQQPSRSQAEYESPSMNDDERIQRAVAAALRAKDDQERQAKEAEKMAHVHKSYQALQDHLDNASGNYEDFDDVVRGHDAPFSEAMRDAALLIPNAADVLYKLGKNKPELQRISALHPLDQAKEMVKLSHALIAGNGNKQAPRPIGQIKSNPVTSQGSVNENTSVSELRKRMKAGWK
jgi:hypothetical protein